MRLIVVWLAGLASGCTDERDLKNPVCDEHSELIHAIRDEYMDHNRLTDEDVALLADGRDMEEKRVILQFQKSLFNDDYIDASEWETIQELGIHQDDLDINEWHYAWLDSYLPYLNEYKVTNLALQREILIQLSEMNPESLLIEERVKIARELVTLIKNKGAYTTEQQEKAELDPKNTKINETLSKFLDTDERSMVPVWYDVISEPDFCSIRETDPWNVTVTKWQQVASIDDAHYTQALMHQLSDAWAQIDFDKEFEGNDPIPFFYHGNYYVGIARVLAAIGDESVIPAFEKFAYDFKTTNYPYSWPGFGDSEDAIKIARLDLLNDLDEYKNGLINEYYRISMHCAEKLIEKQDKDSYPAILAHIESGLKSRLRSYSYYKVSVPKIIDLMVQNEGVEHLIAYSREALKESLSNNKKYYTFGYTYGGNDIPRYILLKAIASSFVKSQDPKAMAYVEELKRDTVLLKDDEMRKILLGEE